MKRRAGFTLIELLVVIAIIGILAAMLFPVFARARESARKTQCLSNVKNIAMAVQMYLSDYDRFPPAAHPSGPEADFFTTRPGRGGGEYIDIASCFRATWANPYLRWPVIFDEYTKNRDVWKCPSAKYSPAVWFIVPQYTNPWWKYLQENIGKWGTGMAVSACAYAYPTGWGGTTTDSIAQQLLASPAAYGWTNAPSNPASQGSFDQNLGTPDEMMCDVSMSEVNDSSWKIVVADGGAGQGTTLHQIRNQLWQFCANGCADWANCPLTRNCGLAADVYDKFWGSASYRNTFTHHMGGANYGFADGHAKWIASEQVATLHEGTICCSKETNYTGSTWHAGQMSGMCPCSPLGNMTG